MIPAQYFVTFSTPGIPDVVVLLDGTPAVVSGGYGGWTIISRQRRVGLTQWQGKDPLRMTIPILFDGFKTRQSQEVAISRLSRMALPPLGGGEPPVISVKGRGIPKPGPVQWVIENPAWGTNVIQDFSASGVMSRLRQDCIVNILEYRGDERTAFQTIAPATLNGKSTVGWPKQYVVQANDTLQIVAAKFYNDSTKWHPIAKLNNIRDPRNLVGIITLTVPAPK